MQDVLPYIAYKEAVVEQDRPHEQQATAAARELQQQQGEAAKQEQ